MTEKVSEQKVSRIHQLYIEGYSEVNIAKRLKVTQSTVSLYINRLKETVDSQGLENAGKEYGTMDSLQSLHDLGAELQKGKLTIEEAKTAFARLLQSDEILWPALLHESNSLISCIKNKHYLLMVFP